MGKKKDKLYKLEPETKAMIAAVRSAVEDCAATGLYGRFMGFEESHTADDYRLTAVFADRQFFGHRPGLRRRRALYTL